MAMGSRIRNQYLSHIFKKFKISHPNFLQKDILHSINSQSRRRIHTLYTEATERTRYRAFSSKSVRPNAKSTPKESSTSNKSENLSSSSALKTIQNALGKTVSTYSVYGACEVIFKECARHAAYKIPSIGTNRDSIPTTEDGEELGVPEGEAQWYNEFHLPVTFGTWSQVTMLHMYLLVARIRNSTPSQVKIWQQHLQDQFFFAAENRMIINHNMQSGSVRSKYLKDLYLQWRGLIAAYDEGLAKGDAVLAAAIWRNIFRAKEDIDIRYLAQIVSFIRHTLQEVDDLLDINNLITFKFPSLSLERPAILAPSQIMNVPFEKEF